MVLSVTSLPNVKQLADEIVTRCVQCCYFWACTAWFLTVNTVTPFNDTFTKYLSLEMCAVAVWPPSKIVTRFNDTRALTVSRDVF